MFLRFTSLALSLLSIMLTLLLPHTKSLGISVTKPLQNLINRCHHLSSPTIFQQNQPDNKSSISRVLTPIFWCPFLIKSNSFPLDFQVESEFAICYIKKLNMHQNNVRHPISSIHDIYHYS